MKKECRVVVHRNYAEGTDAYAFWSEADAKQSIQEDVKTVAADLEQQGYKPVRVLERLDSSEVYVADGDIYYEWQIVPTTIR